MKPNMHLFDSIWSKLPRWEKDLIEKVKLEEAYELADSQLSETQEIWLKLNCIIMHDYFELDEEQLLESLVAWKRMYRINERIESKAKQKIWLESEMKRCFPTCGFPKVIVDSMKRGRK